MVIVKNAMLAIHQSHNSETEPVLSDLLSILLIRNSENGIKIRVDNLHYDLTEEDLKVIIPISVFVRFYTLLNASNQELFSRIGHVLSVSLLYDRQDRSKGIAFVQYTRESDARVAIREFDGANAHGQPIMLTQMPSKQPQQFPRNPFDHVEGPSRSLFERVDSSNVGNNNAVARKNHRSATPDDNDDYRTRRSDVTKPPPDHIDRYVPNRRNTRSPMPRIGGGGGGRDGGRRPGARRDNSVRKDAGDGRAGGGGGGRDGRRPKKTSDDLDAEMADYWGDRGNNEGTNGTRNNQEVNAGNGFGSREREEVEEDVDMIE